MVANVQFATGSRTFAPKKITWEQIHSFNVCPIFIINTFSASCQTKFTPKILDLRADLLLGKTFNFEACYICKYTLTFYDNVKIVIMVDVKNKYKQYSVESATWNNLKDLEKHCQKMHNQIKWKLKKDTMNRNLKLDWPITLHTGLHRLRV